MPVEVLRFSSPTLLAEAAATAWMDAAANRPPDTGSYTVALSGGRIARTFFQAVLREPRARLLLARPVHFFWADERCVPPEHPDSNYGLARRELLEPLGVPDERVHRWRGELPPDQAVLLAAQELAAVVPARVHGVPRLDLVLLGMGEDGHVASLFPHMEVRHADPARLCLHVLGAKPPPDRLTLNFSVLAAARDTWVLVSGPGKESTLRRALGGDPTLPLGKLLLTKPTTKIYTDLPV